MIKICVYISFGERELRLEYIKRISVFLLVSVLFLSVVSCAKKNAAQDLVEKVYSSLERYDEESVYDLFNDEMKENEELKEDVKTFVSQLRDEGLNFDKVQVDYCGGGETKNYEKGRIIHWSGRARIRRIENGMGKEYEIQIAYVATEANEPNRVGVKSIRFVEKDGTNNQSEDELLMYIGKTEDKYVFINNIG